MSPPFKPKLLSGDTDAKRRYRVFFAGFFPHDAWTSYIPRSCNDTNRFCLTWPALEMQQVEMLNNQGTGRWPRDLAGKGDGQWKEKTETQGFHGRSQTRAMELE